MGSIHNTIVRLFLQNNKTRCYDAKIVRYHYEG